MARYIEPVCKLCRREGEKLFLKGERCYTSKCAFERRSYGPGQHGQAGQGRNRRMSDYSRQLRAKQKARSIYGVLEKQFRRYYSIAIKTRGITGLIMLQILEARLDNVVYRMGFAANRAQARQMVNHGHFIVNGRKTDIPSMVMKAGDTIQVREESKKNGLFKDLAEQAEKTNCALWLERDLKTLSGRVLRMPERGEIDGNLNEQLIVEYYSR
ncbi:30S ribosomal protein S4 [Pelolinea submarina]|jgi:small subunit ribosomal protein S4|uniref:Small ribosomal subunit protein uS4 n=1 Tax=Pelolinea submarina TaxID=913107 RepID=A0A347ZVA6_9CHLR|nr:30S ribosomal protein S4 [Pelolinea submarina]REG10177.1 small subunit ribosomal protein S4 [Pelolinea submarina]BBB49237.1 small subunit ribosomal protein S4 [Pelolinea submarina]